MFIHKVQREEYGNSWFAVYRGEILYGLFAYELHARSYAEKMMSDSMTTYIFTVAEVQVNP